MRELLRFETMIAEIKNYTVGLEDKVTEITQKVERKDLKVGEEKLRKLEE